MPLTDAQCGYLERRLFEERARVRQTLELSVAVHVRERGREPADDFAGVPLHLADTVPDTLEADLTGAYETRLSRELADIDDALDRLRRAPERFGTCRDTGGEIPFEGLDRVPWARTCAEVRA
jgi:RNA polymerase-binding transcription factor DksA